MPIKEYNGHHCWSCWNVALWLGNDEGLYRAARHYWESNQITKYKHVNATRAARMLMVELPSKTPDGAKYTAKAVKSALIGLFAE